MRAFATLDSIPNRPFVLPAIRSNDCITFLLICCPHKAVKDLHDNWLRLRRLEETMVVELWARFGSTLFECGEARTQRLEFVIIEINRQSITRRKSYLLGGGAGCDLAGSTRRHGMLCGNIIF